MVHEYKELAAKLGDIEYKLQLLQKQKEEVIERIKILDAIAGRLNEKAAVKNEKEK